MSIHLPGDFTFIPANLDDDPEFPLQIILTDAFQAVTAAECWELIKQEPNGGAFGFSTDPWISKITAEMKYEGHTPSSWAWTMYQMQNIARDGWDAYVAHVRAFKRNGGFCGMGYV